MKNVLLLTISILTLTFVMAQTNPLSQFLNVNNPSNYITPSPTIPSGFTINCQQWLSDLQNLEEHCEGLGRIPGGMMISFQRELLNNNGHSNPNSEAIRERILAAAIAYNQCKTLLDEGWESYILNSCPLP